MHARAHQLTVLTTRGTRIDHGTWWELLASVFRRELPWFDEEDGRWMKALGCDRPARRRFMTGSEAAALDQLPDLLNVWRAVPAASPAVGFSFFLDESSARTFAATAADAPGTARRHLRGDAGAHAEAARHRPVPGPRHAGTARAPGQDRRRNARRHGLNGPARGRSGFRRGGRPRGPRTAPGRAPARPHRPVPADGGPASASTAHRPRTVQWLAIEPPAQRGRGDGSFEPHALRVAGISGSSAMMVPSPG